MTRRGLGLVGWGLLGLAAVAQAQTPAGTTLKGKRGTSHGDGHTAAPSPADSALQAKGLEREGGTFVHSSEAAAVGKVDEVREAYKRLSAAMYKLAEVDQSNQMIAELNMQAAYLKQDQAAINAQSRSMPRMPRGAGNMMRQNIAAAAQQDQMAINQTNQQIAALKKAAPSAEVRKGLEDDLTKRKDEMAQAVEEARKLVDETHAAYEGLAKDESVKAALALAKTTTTDAVKLGPSKDFHAAVKSLDAAERMLNLKAATSAKGSKAKAKSKR